MKMTDYAGKQTNVTKLATVCLSPAQDSSLSCLER